MASVGGRVDVLQKCGLGWLIIFQWYTQKYIGITNWSRRIIKFFKNLIPKHWEGT